MNKYRERILNSGRESGVRIALPESHDQRVREAAQELTSLGFEIVNQENYKDKLDAYINFLQQKPFTKNWPEKNIQEYLEIPLHFAMTMAACDDTDVLVAGADTPSSEVLRTAIRIIGISPSSNWVSSIFFMIAPGGDRAFTFADCAVIPEPDNKQLAVIAADSAKFHQLLSGEDPRVAFLSFSTKGSASHYRVDRVKDAVYIFSRKNISSI